MNEQRLQRIEELKDWYKDQILGPEDIALIFNEGYILGFNTALLPREENKDDNR